jgi:hypothetical protein
MLIMLLPLLKSFFRQAQLNLLASTQEDALVINVSDLAATSIDTSPSSTHKKTAPWIKPTLSLDLPES